MNQSSDLTIIYCCPGEPAVPELEEYKEISGQLIIVCKHKHAYELVSYGFQVVGWVPEEGKVAAMNKAVRQAEGEHILWLEEGERLLEIPDLSKNTFHRARVVNDKTERPVHNWQVRLFPNTFSGEALFKGFEIPDLGDISSRLNWEQSDYDITIHRQYPLFPPEVIMREVEGETRKPAQKFWEAMLSAENEDYNTAIKCFKRVINKKGLSPWNRLAAFNGLANVLVETQQLQKAKQYAERSLEISPNQRAPYLTLYQYYSTRGKSKEACDALAEYRNVMDRETDANWDVYLPESQAVFLMAEISFRSGWHEQAYRHYEEFYVYNNGQVSQPVLEKLFVYAVELQNRKKAMRYFEAIFGSDISADFDRDTSARISEALWLFADKGWHDLASDIYGKLLSQRPEDDNLRRSCMRALIKNDELKKAQALL